MIETFFFFLKNNCLIVKKKKVRKLIFQCNILINNKCIAYIDKLDNILFIICIV